MCKEKKEINEFTFGDLIGLGGLCLSYPLFSNDALDKLLEYIKKEVDDRKCTRSGKSVKDTYINGEHVKHVEKELDENGEWKTVYARNKEVNDLTDECCKKKPISCVLEKPESGCCDDKADREELLKLIKAYKESNRKLEMENARLKESIEEYSAEMDNLNKLMTSMGESIKIYNDNKKKI